MLPISITSPTQSTPDRSPEKIADAAHQFEALLVEQMLRTMRGSWLGAEDDKSSESLMEYAEQEFARVMTAGGGFGLARMISDSLSRTRD